MEISEAVELLEKNTDMVFVEKTEGVVKLLKDGTVIDEKLISRMHQKVPDGVYYISEATCSGGKNDDCRVGAPSPTCTSISPTKCGVYYMSPFANVLMKPSDLGIIE